MAILIVPNNGKANTPVRPKIGAIQVDANIKEQHNYKSTVPRFPTESGFSVTDSIIREPDTLTLQCIVSATPFTGVGTSGVTEDMSPYRADNAYTKLKKLQATGTLVDVSTGLRVYRRLAITSLSVPRAKDTGMSFIFDITFAEIRIATTKGVLVEVLTEDVKPKLPHSETEEKVVQGDSFTVADNTRVSISERLNYDGESILTYPARVQHEINRLKEKNREIEVAVYGEEGGGLAWGRAEWDLIIERDDNELEIKKLEKDLNKFYRDEKGKDLVFTPIEEVELFEQADVPVSELDAYQTAEDQQLIRDLGLE